MLALHSSALGPRRRTPPERPWAGPPGGGGGERGMNFQRVPRGCHGAHSHAKRLANVKGRTQRGRRRAGEGLGARPPQSAPFGACRGRGRARRAPRAVPLPRRSRKGRSWLGQTSLGRWGHPLYPSSRGTPSPLPAPQPHSGTRPTDTPSPQPGALRVRDASGERRRPAPPRPKVTP